MDATQAKQELRSARTKDALARRLRLTPSVPGAIKKLLRKALKSDKPWEALRVIDTHPDGVGPLFEGMSDAARLRLIKKLLPNVASFVDAAWRALESRPYLQGEFRRPFRCPHTDSQLAEIRGTWLLKTALILGDYEHDITWVATWAAHIADWQGATDLGWLLAGGLNVGGSESDEVLEILNASINGEHEVAQMGRHVTRALMASSRADAWDLNEKLLLAAQRQEGLRQVVLESVDESHPEAFRRMLRLILKENLSRFSSVVRAFDTWFGFMWDGASGIEVNRVLEKVLAFFDDAEQRAAAIAGADAELAYLALWTIAFEDVETVIPVATKMLADPSIEKRFVATHLLVQTDWISAQPQLAAMLQDDDLRVAARALVSFQEDSSQWVEPATLFGHLELLLERIKKRSVKLESIVWPWWNIKLERCAVAQAMSLNSESLPAARMLPYIKDLDTHRRERYVRHIAGIPRLWPREREKEPKPLTGDIYDAVLGFLGDASSDVRGAAFQAFGGTQIKPKETDRIVTLLSRKAGDLRYLCIDRLRSLADSEMVAVAGRLLGDKDELRRLAGLELLRDAVETDRSVERARALAQDYGSGRDSLDDVEQAHLDGILGTAKEVPVLDDALGLIDPAKLRTWPDPKPQAVSVSSDASARCIDSLAKLILEHQDFEILSSSGDQVLLINAGYRVSGPTTPANAIKQEVDLPLAEVWQAWNSERENDLRDTDGLELVRAWMAPDDGREWTSVHATQLVNSGRWSPGVLLLRNLLEWCMYWQPPSTAQVFLLDALESGLTELTKRDFLNMAESPFDRVRSWVETKKPYEQRILTAGHRLEKLRSLCPLFPSKWREQDGARLYALLCWFKTKSKGYGNLEPRLQDFLDAYSAGAFGESGVEEFTDLLIGRGSELVGMDLVRDVSGQKPYKELADHPELLEALDRCRRRIVEVETQRGDRTTAASSAAMQLRWSGGLEAVSLALQALGTTKFARNGGWYGEAPRKDTLSNLVARSAPREDDSHEAFALWAKSAKISEARLVEVAAYAPQWVDHINHLLEWPGLESAIWWIQAHTKDDRWGRPELKEIWQAEVSERTPLTAQDLTEGAVDVDWFRATYAELGAKRWKVLYNAAKYASSSGGHKRAQLFASAMSGNATQQELLLRIDEKRHQDSVRSLGLIPLAKGQKREADLLGRYRRLQDFKRESRKFGSQRQASESRAMTIGMENLARTAGFKDPLRLHWAMEMEAVKDLAQGPVTLSKDEVTIELRIDDDGKPVLTVLKKDRKLKSIPAKLRKDPDVVELSARLKELRRQASRTKAVLEEAMCRGDEFDGSELQALAQHPILAPSFKRLVFIGDDIIGYPVEDGQALANHQGMLEPVRKQERLRIAHPHDLLDRGDWSSWQRECFRSERIQPFKQVFREVYPITGTERNDKFRSRRYAGHQVNPRQALALLGSRGWVAKPEEGLSKTYHQADLTARLGFEEAFYTPADVEGLTLELVAFTKKGKWEPTDLATVPTRVFSETMRDLDLVVSVAHQGGVDPEATASTIEMRSTLMRESCRLLGLKNVEVKDNNVIIRGELGHYSIHLGSAVVHLLGGPSLVIVAVQSQHRGRMFLPFADDDPRTAEVLSKVFLLARDRKIQDPNILDQIRSGQR